MTDSFVLREFSRTQADSSRLKNPFTWITVLSELGLHVEGLLCWCKKKWAILRTKARKRRKKERDKERMSKQRNGKTTTQD